MKRNFFFIASLVGLFLVQVSFAKTTLTSRFDETYDFRSGGQVAVENVNGKVVVESWDKEAVRVQAEIEVRARSRKVARDFLDRVEIVVRRSGGRMIIKTEHPKIHGGSLLDAIFGSSKPSLRVDFRILVPRSCNVDVESVNGAVEARDVVGRAELRTTNGRIVGRGLVGSVDASTTNGSIRMELLEVASDDEIRLRTVNGSVKLYLPEDAGADLEVKTVNGSIRTDFPLEVKGKWGPKKLWGEINGGGAEIRVSTVNGSASVLIAD